MSQVGSAPSVFIFPPNLSDVMTDIYLATELPGEELLAKANGVVCTLNDNADAAATGVLYVTSYGLRLRTTEESARPAPAPTLVFGQVGGPISFLLYLPFKNSASHGVACIACSGVGTCLLFTNPPPPSFLCPRDPVANQNSVDGSVSRRLSLTAVISHSEARELAPNIPAHSQLAHRWALCGRRGGWRGTCIQMF